MFFILIYLDKVVIIKKFYFKDNNKKVCINIDYYIGVLCIFVVKMVIYLMFLVWIIRYFINYSRF